MWCADLRGENNLMMCIQDWVRGTSFWQRHIDCHVYEQSLRNNQEQVISVVKNGLIFQEENWLENSQISGKLKGLIKRHGQLFWKSWQTFSKMKATIQDRCFKFLQRDEITVRDVTFKIPPIELTIHTYYLTNEKIFPQ